MAMKKTISKIAGTEKRTAKTAEPRGNDEARRREAKTSRKESEAEKKRIHNEKDRAKVEVYRENKGHGVKVVLFDKEAGKKPTPKKKSRSNARALKDVAPTSAVSVQKAPKEEFATVTVGKRRYNIPVDEKGNVPYDRLVTRFLDQKKGTKDNQNRRSTAIDIDTTAKKQISIKNKNKIKPEDIKEWWAHPNKSDIIGIDDEHNKVFDTAGATRRSSKKYQRKIGIVNATEEESKMIRKTLDSNFTAAELKTMTENGGITYESANLPGSTSGVYYAGTSNIEFDRQKRGMSPTTITHETTHKLRYDDPSRKGILRSVAHKKVWNSADVDMEEAVTEAETRTRLSPYGKPVRGYYSFLKGDPEKLMDEDRKLFVGKNGPDSRGLKGKRATASVEKNFDKSNIRKLKTR